MSERPKAAVIVNPAARKDGAVRRWPAIRAELARRLAPFEPRFAEAPGRAAALARATANELSGAHAYHPRIRISRGTSFRFESEVDTLVDLDGETVGRLPLEVSALPRAFNVGAV